MDDFVSFDNKILHLLNPLPPITVAELHERAKVVNRKPRNGARQVFDLELRWGGGTWGGGRLRARGVRATAYPFPLEAFCSSFSRASRIAASLAIAR